MRIVVQIIVIGLVIGAPAVGIGQSTVAAPQDFSTLQVKKPNGITRYAEPIILRPDTGLGEAQIFNPAVLVTGNRLTMLYCSRGKDGGELRLAFSDDGRNFVRSPTISS